MKRQKPFFLLFLSVSLLTGCQKEPSASSASLTQGSEDKTSENTSSPSVTKKEDLVAEHFSFDYYHESEQLNCAAGLVLIHLSCNSLFSSLSLKWGDDNAPFEDYDSLYETDKLSADEYEYDFKDHALIPSNATKLWLLGYGKDGEILEKATKDRSEYKKQEKLLYEFQVISDEQISTKNPCFYRRSKKAFADIKENCPDTSLIAVNGDIVDEAKAENYDSFFDSYYESYSEEDRKKLALGLGNHEFIRQSENGYYQGRSEKELEKKYQDRLSLWETKTGNENPYFSMDLNGSTCLFLGTTKIPNLLGGNTRADCTLGEKQLSWRREKVTEADKRGKPIYIFSHGSLRDTVSGSLSKLNQTWYGYSEKEEKEIRDILSLSKNILFFSSHSHWCFESEQPYLVQDNVSFFNTAAVGYLWEGNGQGHSYKNLDYEHGGGQGLYLSVYENQIFVKGRQFEASDGQGKYWFSNYQTVIDLEK